VCRLNRALQGKTLPGHTARDEAPRASEPDDPWGEWADTKKPAAAAAAATPSAANAAASNAAAAAREERASKLAGAGSGGDDEGWGGASAAGAAAGAAAAKPKKATKIRMGAKKKPGVKKLGASKKLGGSKAVSKAAPAAAVDWDNEDAALPAEAPEPAAAAAAAAVAAEWGDDGGATALESAISQAKKAPAAAKPDRRAGFGQMGGLGFGAVGGGVEREPEREYSSAARDKFSGAKHISSDDFASGDGGGTPNTRTDLPP